MPTKSKSKAEPKAEPKAESPSPSRSGTTLVRAHVAFYAGLAAGRIGEVPNEIADAAVANGYATKVDSLDERMKGEPPAPKLASDVNPPGTTGPQALADSLAESDE